MKPPAALHFEVKSDKMSPMKNDELCPCKSGKKFGECCGPVLSGATRAETAEALMRARYSAYVTGEVDFLRTSATKAVQEDFDAAASKAWSEADTWHGLEIISTRNGQPGDE